MSNDQAIIFDSLGSLDLDPAHPAIYDRPIGLRLLHQDPDSQAEHYLVRYPAGLKARRHRHTVAHTIVVLEGRLEANGQVVGPGGYCHFLLASRCTTHPRTASPACSSPSSTARST